VGSHPSKIVNHREILNVERRTLAGRLRGHYLNALAKLADSLL
jgi:hypothetical protein